MTPVFVLTLSDVLGIAGIICVLGFIAVLLIPIWFKQWRCKHDGDVSETSACNAICLKCRKNLGFIGNWRKP